MKIVFMGTPEFAVPSLIKLIEEFDVQAVLTQPDKPKGRGKKLAMSEVKEAALKYSIPVFQLENLKNDREIINKLKEIAPDYIIVVAFGQILTREVLDIPKYGCINLHASILPKYRGAAPINWAILKGEKTTGNTTMMMDTGLDTGDILLKSEVEITDNMTAGELHDILKEDGSELLIKTIHGLQEGRISRVKQSGRENFYASMLNKEMAKIDWSKSNREIHNQIRGLNPWPVAYTHYNGIVMKIYGSKIIDGRSKSVPGTITNVSKNGIEVACGEGHILLETVQFPGGKPLIIEEYIKGHSIDKNILLL
jgi:methionyl-tRNA formyltransferase